MLLLMSTQIETSFTVLTYPKGQIYVRMYRDAWLPLCVNAGSCFDSKLARTAWLIGVSFSPFIFQCLFFTGGKNYCIGKRQKLYMY